MKQLSVKSGKQLCLRWLLKAMVILQFLAIIFFNYTKAYDFLDMDSAGCIFRKNCASVPEERSAIPLQTEQSSAG